MPRAKNKPQKTDANAEPDALVRQEAGSYRTADDRFEVRGADGAWYLVDTSRTDELGQEVLLGPFPTLKAVRQAIPDARRP